MAKGKQVYQTKGGEIPPATIPTGPGPDAPKDDRIQVIQGNTPVLTIQILASINKNIVEVGKKLDELINIAKNG